MKRRWGAARVRGMAQSPFLLVVALLGALVGALVAAAALSEAVTPRVGCPYGPGDASDMPADSCPAARETLILATTTSTKDSGLLDALLPRFEAETGIHVLVRAVGTGEALALGEQGRADALLVHAPEAERDFVAAGHGIERRDVFYNDFVIVGPPHDPAGIWNGPQCTPSEPGSAAEALARLWDRKARFVSRGDDSGTHKKEVELWTCTPAESDPLDEPWYTRAKAGMGATLRLASKRRAYTLCDRGTFLALSGRNGSGAGAPAQDDRARAQYPASPALGLAILYQGTPDLRNPYSVLYVNPKRHPGVNLAAARRFSAFLLEPETQAQIAAFGKDRFGEPLFRTYGPADRP